MPITTDRQPRPAKPNKGGPSLGLIILLVFGLTRFFGPQVNRWLRNGQFQLPGGIGSTVPLFWVIGGVFFLVVAVVVLKGMFASGRTSSRLPTPTTYQPVSPDLSPQLPRQQPSLPASLGRPQPRPSNQALPSGGLRYDRAFNGKALLASLLVGVLLFGGIFMLRVAGLI